jgi:hypothetical protein
MPAIMVTMFEVTSDTSLSIPMLLCSILARSVSNLWGTDGWAHLLYHSPHLNLPHHSVDPNDWPDNDTLTQEDRNKRTADAHHAHDDHGHGGHGHNDAGHGHYGSKDQVGRVSVSSEIKLGAAIAHLAKEDAAVTDSHNNPIHSL